MKKKEIDNGAPLVIVEEYWANSMLSIVRHTAMIEFRGHRYIIVDKLGRDIFEASEIAEKEGRDKAIEPGEPCDLCRMDFVPTYRAIGREKVIELIKAGKTKEEIEKIAKDNGK